MHPYDVSLLPFKSQSLEEALYDVVRKIDFL